jgi:hypothetical protein
LASPGSRRFSLRNNSGVSDPPQARTVARGNPPLGGRDARIVFGIGVVCLLLVGGLWATSRNAPSAVQQESVTLETAAVTGEQGCANFANFWMLESRVAVPAEAISGLSNCRQAEDGSWFVPIDASDPRIPEVNRLSVSEREAVAVLSAQLANDLVALDLTMPTSLRESLKANYEAENTPVFGHLRKGRGDLVPKRARYVRITQAFLLAPERSALADYVGWLMARRLDAVELFEQACFADPDTGYVVRACKGLREEFGVRYIPLLWDLTDPVLLQEFLVARVRSGEALPAEEPSTVSARQVSGQ